MIANPAAAVGIPNIVYLLLLKITVLSSVPGSSYSCLASSTEGFSGLLSLLNELSQVAVELQGLCNWCQIHLSLHLTVATAAVLLGLPQAFDGPFEQPLRQMRVCAVTIQCLWTLKHSATTYL